jgi:CheY-like chemotaxis protein
MLERAASGRSGGPLILLVDDSQDNRTLCAELLEEDGFRVDTAVDGLDALDKVAAALPDAILMDVSMPDMDGWEAIRRLKADPTTRGIPMIVVSGDPYGPAGSTPQDVGCDAVLTKPFHLQELVAIIRRLIAERSDS